MLRTLRNICGMALIGSMLCAGEVVAQSAQGKQTLVTGFTREQVIKYKVIGQQPYTLQRDGSFDAKGKRGGLDWLVVETLSDGRLIVKTPEQGLVGFDGTQVKTNLADDAKSCSAVASLGVKSRNLSSQGLNECPK